MCFKLYIYIHIPQISILYVIRRTRERDRKGEKRRKRTKKKNYTINNDTIKRYRNKTKKN